MRLAKLFAVCSASLACVFAHAENYQEITYDENHTRFRLVKSVAGDKIFNFLFLPGGPGVDSSCFNDLIKCMHAPGNYWLVDLPFNGTNQPSSLDPGNICQKWDSFLIKAVKKFENPILLGHSFGGYLPLFCPDLENALKGLIILNSVPTLQSEWFAKKAKEQNPPSLLQAQAKLIQQPSLDALKELYLLESYYFFSPKNRIQGVEQVIKKLEFCLSTEHWWYVNGPQHYSAIKWIPQKTPTLIVGGTDDFITPLEIFLETSQFHRDNIEIVNIEEAGHFPWIEQPQVVNAVLSTFISKCDHSQ